MTAVAQSPGLLTELRRWVGVGAVGGILASAAGWALMRAEADYAPTCFFSLCDDAHVPGPFFLLWMMVEVTTYYLLPLALVASAWECWVALRKRLVLTHAALGTIAAGPLALAISMAYRAFAFDQSGVFDGVWRPLHAIVVVSLASVGSSYLWLALIAGGVLMLWRREGSPRAAAALIGAGLLSAALDFWIVHFNHGVLP